MHDVPLFVVLTSCVSFFSISQNPRTALCSQGHQTVNVMLYRVGMAFHTTQVSLILAWPHQQPKANEPFAIGGTPPYTHPTQSEKKTRNFWHNRARLVRRSPNHGARPYRRLNRRFRILTEKHEAGGPRPSIKIQRCFRNATSAPLCLTCWSTASHRSPRRNPLCVVSWSSVKKPPCVEASCSRACSKGPRPTVLPVRGR